MLLVLISLALVGLILIQQGKGADIGAAFGSGSANALLGSAGAANTMTRLTTWLAVGFFAITFGLAYIASQKAATIDTLGLPDAALIEQQQAASAAAAAAAAEEAPVVEEYAPPAEPAAAPANDAPDWQGEDLAPPTE